MNAAMRAGENAILAVAPYTDYETARKLVVEQWGDDAFIISGKVYPTSEMTLLGAWTPLGQLRGLAYYKVNGSTMLLGAIITIGERAKGVGKILFDAVLAEARTTRMRKMRALTTNDNFEAMKFYQRCGMRFETLYPGGADAFRAFKPGIYRNGKHGLPLRDILEFELSL